MATWFASNEEVSGLFGGQSDAITIAPRATDKLAWLDSGQTPLSVEALAQPRAVQSPKSLFLPPAEPVGRYGAGEPAATALEARPLVLVGIRACDLRARAYLDKVMLGGEFEDVLYRRRREAMTLVTCDCVDCTESCFCTLVGGKPYAVEGYDVNLTPMDGGVLVEAATEKGQQLLGGAKLAEATSEQLARRDEIRQAMTDRLGEQNAQFTFSVTDASPPKLPEGDDPAWQAFAADCVECAACTNICPTCHCFYLYDQVLGAEAFERVRTWDSCLLSTYDRMAGGAGMKSSPRPALSSRLANRVLHKFVYSPQQYDLLGCVGCGRCVEACIGAIDIRQVVQTLGAGQG